MIEESEYCGDVMKKHFSNELVISKEEHFENSANVGSVTMIILIVILKSEIIVISLEKIEVLCTETVVSILN